MRGHYYHYGLGAHSTEKTTTIEERLKAVEDECAARRRLAEDLELKRARIQNGKHPEYKNGCVCGKRKPCDATPPSQAGADAAPEVGETPS